MPKFQSGAEESESASVTRHTTVIRDIMVITRAMATAITGVIHIPERIIAGGRTTTAASLLQASQALLPLLECRISVRLLRCLGSNSKPAFLFASVSCRGVREKNPARLQRIVFAKHRT